MFCLLRCPCAETDAFLQNVKIEQDSKVIVGIQMFCTDYTDTIIFVTASLN